MFLDDVVYVADFTHVALGGHQGFVRPVRVGFRQPDSGYEDGCVPITAKAVYYTFSMPSQKRLYDEMGTKRAGGTTLSVGARVIQRYYQGRSTPIAEPAEDPDTVISRVAAMADNYHQGTILGWEPGISHWRGWETGKVRYGGHAVGTYGYYLGDGGYLFLADGFNNPRWGADNPYGHNHKIPLARVWAAMEAEGDGAGQMIW
jgi:hypothetical protein